MNLNLLIIFFRSDKTLATALEVFYEENAKLVEHLENQGTPSRPILTGVFEATPLDPKVPQSPFVNFISKKKKMRPANTRNIKKKSLKKKK
jgi:hypothetical protein